jgi:hypothetical protein
MAAAAELGKTREERLVQQVQVGLRSPSAALGSLK